MVSLLLVVAPFGMEVVLDAVDVVDVLVVCSVLVLRNGVLGTEVVEISDVDAIVGLAVSEDVLLDGVVVTPVMS